MLWPAQPLGLLGTVRRGNSAVRPGQPSLGGFVKWLEPRRSDREDATLSLYQDIARIGSGGRDQRNSTGQPK